jgi:hypothetical protein
MPKRRRRYNGPTPSRAQRQQATERAITGRRDAKTTRVRLPGRAVHAAKCIFTDHVHTGCGVTPQTRQAEWLPNDTGLTCRSCIRWAARHEAAAA